jgi:hypothetical protein
LGNILNFDAVEADHLLLRMARLHDEASYVGSRILIMLPFLFNFGSLQRCIQLMYSYSSTSIDKSMASSRRLWRNPPDHSMLYYICRIRLAAVQQLFTHGSMHFEAIQTPIFICYLSSHGVVLANRIVRSSHGIGTSERATIRSESRDAPQIPLAYK